MAEAGSEDDGKTEGGRICVVTEGGPYAWIIINALGGRFGTIDVIVEEPESRSTLLKRRARKLGRISAAGQLATMALAKLGKSVFAKRIERIVAENGLEAEPKPEHRVHRVPSVNDPAFLDAIARIGPQVVLLNGCRMVKAAVLAAIPCPVLNYHAGITPAYRGMNGGYWALASGDRSNFGATVHLVDPGVDTGAILCQVRGEPAKDDTIATYAHRLAALSRGICIRAVEDALAGRLQPTPPQGPSRQWYHPPIWTYLWNGLVHGVW